MTITFYLLTLSKNIITTFREANIVWESEMTNTTEDNKLCSDQCISGEISVEIQQYSEFWIPDKNSCLSIAESCRRQKSRKYTRYDFCCLPSNNDEKVLSLNLICVKFMIQTNAEFFSVFSKKNPKTSD